MSGTGARSREIVWGTKKIPLTSFWFKTSLVRNLSYENKFYLHEKEPVEGPHFRLNGFVRSLFDNSEIVYSDR